MSGPRAKIAAMQLQSLTVNSIKEIATDVFVISFKRHCSFTAGQVVAVTTSRDIEPRLYSIASGINDENIDILFNIKADGILSPKLALLKPGDSIFVTDAFGEFLGSTEPAYWIASGTGIAPFRAMFRSGLSKNKQLIHGGRYGESFYFNEEFCKMDYYLKCVSGETLSDAYNGRLTAYLKQQDKLPKDHKYYICGSAEMVVDVRDLLIEKGISFNQIMAEIYF